ncbi:hypothetical protein [Flavobacterium sp.]|uniref:hypothetical protein n=1 Tax=Flavobacterium sp. TaxID=239 RepID=UPI001B5FC8BD|nr:hypothetical protein [Flavobacterium sp.]MBP6182938.1 hypothetical protein [Flavobacterium sp.]
MKKIILVSCYIIACIVIVSCTNDGVETTPNNKQQVSAYTGGGQNGQTLIPPPK